MEQPVKDNISQKPPVTQVPQKTTDGEPTAKQNNLSAPTQQSKHISHTEGSAVSWGEGTVMWGKYVRMMQFYIQACIGGLHVL